jgi:zinc transport system ATP-binding protein
MAKGLWAAKLFKENKVSGAPIHPIEKKIDLRFDKVSFSYSGVKVLEDASFHIHQGEFIALVGPNGSGKTTVLKLLLGLEKPQKGRIEIFGREDFRNVREQVGYVPQQTQTDRSFPITVAEVVKMGRLRSLSRKYRSDDKAAVAFALEQAEIAALASRPYSALSGGQRRRVLVARALASRPGLLVLDEPTANMDAESESRLYKTLGRLKGGTTILIVTHDMEFVSSLTDRVLCMGKEPAVRDGGRSNYVIVQHRLEASAAPHRGGSGESRNARILHGESIPGDSCFGDAMNGTDK